MPLALSQRTLAEDASPPFEAGRKLGHVEMALVWQVLHEDPQCPSRVVLEKVAQRQVPMAVSVRHLNRLRAKWKLNRRKGRPGHTALSRPVCAGRSGRPSHAPSVVCGRASLCPLARSTGDAWRRLWPDFSRRSRRISTPIPTTTLPCCIIGSRPCCVAFRPCFLPPCWGSRP